ncbi:MAG TPA: hypothetical protein VGK40_00830, partial [Verrucomicrobiae bacterium]
MNEKPQMKEGVAGSEGVTLFGQTFAYPRTFWSVLPVAFVCATIAFALYLIVPSTTKETPPSRRLWTPLVVTPEGNPMVVPDSLRLEFWTPSSKTRVFLAKEGGTARDAGTWEAIESEEPVMQFGRLLHSDSDVLGYRRAEVWGHGRTTLKPGWWWSMTVKTNYSVGKLVRT